MKAVCCSSVSFEDAAPLFLGGEGSEDLVVEAEVGVVHVRPFDGSGELEGEVAEDGYVRVGLHLFSLLLSFSPPLLGGLPPHCPAVSPFVSCAYGSIISVNLSKQRGYR